MNPEKSLNYTEYLKEPSWRLYEAIVLWHGTLHNPNFCNTAEEFVQAFRSEKHADIFSKNDKEITKYLNDFSSKLSDDYEQAKSAVRNQKLSLLHHENSKIVDDYAAYIVSPREFCHWAYASNWDLNTGLEKAISQRWPKFFNSQSANLRKQLNGFTNEQSSLLKMIFAMASAQYAYDPNDLRSRSTSKIKKDLELMGYSLDPETIRKHLKSSSKLPKDK